MNGRCLKTPQIAPKRGSALGSYVQAESMVQLALAIPVGCFVGILLGTWLDRHFHQHWMAITGLFHRRRRGLHPDLYLAGPLLQARRSVSAEPDYSKTTDTLTDADVRNTMLAAIRLLAILSAVAAALFWWRSGWPSALLLVVGAAISSTSLWEWLRLMTAINERMDAGATPRPMGMILFGFFAPAWGLPWWFSMLVLSICTERFWLSLAGLGLGLISLSIEAFRLLKR